MNNLVTVEHPEMTLGELHSVIDVQPAPVRRSTHVGNQPPSELILMTLMPPGIDILAVDTIQGNDKYASPRHIILDGAEIPICEDSQAKGRVVGSIAVSKLGDKKRVDPRCNDLVVVPEIGESLLDFHMRGIEALRPNNMPIPMSTYFSRHSDTLRATIATLERAEERLTHVTGEGSILPVVEASSEELGIFGLSDVTASTEGVMPPLNAMMAIDMLISSQAGAERTIHLGGPDMVRYTRDEERMERIGVLMGEVAAHLEIEVVPHVYEVVDITGLERLVSSATHASQHQLLRARRTLELDLERDEALSCAQHPIMVAA